MAVKIVVEFYRTRPEDNAHAIVGREAIEATNLDSAIEAARQLSLTLDMPQRPDGMSITGAEGTTLYSGLISLADLSREMS